MPILVKDFTWEESESHIYISVPLKGVPANRVDIFSAGQYLKVSYPPYVFEIYMKEAVIEDSSKATIAGGLVKFEYEKCQPEIWDMLQAVEVTDKKFMVSARHKALEDAHKKAQDLAEKKAKEKQEQQRLAVKEQMKKDEDEKRKIEEEKENIRKEATRNIEQWKENEVNGNKNKEIYDEISQADDEDDDLCMTKRNEKNEEKDELPKKSFSKKVKKKKDIPPPRCKGTIQVTFSPRVFKTPSRESKAPEEEEWLAKVAAAGRTTKVDDSDAVGMEEMNPLWLKDKGSNFYKNGNYVAAINAFTAAIVLDGKIPSLYSNRAACHLQMKQFKECIQDCTCALELLTPVVPANALSRCKALVRRGTALAFLDDYVQALGDYEKAIELDPENTKLKEDVQKLRNTIQGT